MSTKTTSELAKPEARTLLLSIIAQPYAWPGGYDRLLVTNDGALLCAACCRKEATRIMSDIRDGCDSGWLPVATTYEAVSAECTREMAGEDYISFCAHCNKEIGELGC